MNDRQRRDIDMVPNFVFDSWLMGFVLYHLSEIDLIQVLVSHGFPRVELICLKAVRVVSD